MSGSERETRGVYPGSSGSNGLWNAYPLVTSIVPEHRRATSLDRSRAVAATFDIAKTRTMSEWLPGDSSVSYCRAKVFTRSAAICPRLALVRGQYVPTPQPAVMLRATSS